MLDFLKWLPSNLSVPKNLLGCFSKLHSPPQCPDLGPSYNSIAREIRILWGMANSRAVAREWKMKWNLLYCHIICVSDFFLTPWARAFSELLPGSSVHGILQTRILKWGAISYSRGSSQPRSWTCISCVSCIGRQILYHWATWEAQQQVRKYSK